MKGWDTSGLKRSILTGKHWVLNADPRKNFKERRFVIAVFLGRRLQIAAPC